MNNSCNCLSQIDNTPRFTTAAQQIEVFSRILKTSVMTYLTSKPEALQKNLEECANMVCHGQHTYVYSQVGHKETEKIGG